MSMVPSAAFAHQLVCLVENRPQFDPEQLQRMLTDPANALQFCLYLKSLPSDQRRHLIVMLPAFYADYIIDRGLDNVIEALREKIARQQIAASPTTVLRLEDSRAIPTPSFPRAPCAVPQAARPDPRQRALCSMERSMESLYPAGSALPMVVGHIEEVQKQYPELSFSEILELLPYLELEFRRLGFDQDHILEVYDRVMYDRMWRDRPSGEVRTDLPGWLSELMLHLCVCMVVLDQTEDVDVDPSALAIPGLCPKEQAVVKIIASQVRWQHDQLRSPTNGQSVFEKYPQVADRFIEQFDLNAPRSMDRATSAVHRTCYYLVPIFDRILSDLDICALFTRMDYCPVCDAPCHKSNDAFGAGSK